MDILLPSIVNAYTNLGMKFATPQTERVLLNIALNGTASHVETVVAAARATLSRTGGIGEGATGN
jgi:hypothetical protein